MTLPTDFAGVYGVTTADERRRAEAARSAAVERDRIAGAVGRRKSPPAVWNSFDDHSASFQSGSIGTQVSSRDRDFRPARRRSVDDDNFEPPRRSFGSTPQFGAQRSETPSGPPVQAVVKWYNPDKGFGFVQLADGSGDAFLHVSVVERSGHGNVPPGATLEVRAGPGPKGPQVTDILSVDSSTAQQEPPRGARPERPMYPPADGAVVEESGRVKWYNAGCSGSGEYRSFPRILALRQSRFES
jgi:cold shock protein